MVTIELFKRENDQMVARHCVCSGSSFLERGSGFHASQGPERHVPGVLLMLFDPDNVLARAWRVLLNKIPSFCSKKLTARVMQLLQGRPDGHPGLCQPMPRTGPSEYPKSFTG